MTEYYIPSYIYRDARDVTVYERPPVNTGLLNKDGTPIYRLPPEIGFRND